MSPSLCLRILAVACLLFQIGMGRARADLIGEWNSYALSMARDAGMTAPEVSRLMAILNASIYNSVEGIAGQHELYTHGTYTGPSGVALPGASMSAAAATAAHTVLYSLYASNSQVVSDINALYTQQLSLMPDDTARSDGLSYGYLVAGDLVNWRSTDGASDAGTGSYNVQGSAGSWVPTLPSYQQALLPGWGNVETFTISGVEPYTGSLGISNSQWIATPEYATQFENVRLLGSNTSGTRTIQQTNAALFWEGAPGTITHVGLWNQIAAGIVSTNSLSVQESARLYAALNLALADAAIVAWNTKYSVDLWSPITAIQNANGDGNAATLQDDNWMPLLNSPNTPSYFAEQAIFGSAAAGILESFAGPSYAFTLGSDTDGDGIADITLNFSSLEEARQMAVMSGLWGGIYFERALLDSATAGSNIADAVLSSQFAVVPEPTSLWLVLIAGAMAMRRRR